MAGIQYVKCYLCFLKSGDGWDSIRKMLSVLFKKWRWHYWQTLLEFTLKCQTCSNPRIVSCPMRCSITCFEFNPGLNSAVGLFSPSKMLRD